MGGGGHHSARREAYICKRFRCFYRDLFTWRFCVSSSLPIMRPYQDQEYEALPVEEKQELEEYHKSVTQTRRKRTFAIFAFILIVVSALSFFAFTFISNAAPSVGDLPVVEEEESIPNREAFLKHAVRAVGDRYLLGTGKADITGYLHILMSVLSKLADFVQTGGRSKLYGIC